MKVAKQFAIRGLVAIKPAAYIRKVYFDFITVDSEQAENTACHY